MTRRRFDGMCAVACWVAVGVETIVAVLLGNDLAWIAVALGMAAAIAQTVAWAGQPKVSA